MKKRNLDDLKWGKRFTYLKNVVFDNRDLRQKGAKFQIIRFLPNSKIGPHYHKKVTEIFFILKGSGEFVFNGRTFKGKKNGIFLCEPGDVHEIINKNSRELVILIYKTNENPKDIFWINPKDSAEFGN
jgi:mannose-6-phosphate isomerase-like protein (cupin superfamily)